MLHVPPNQRLRLAALSLTMVGCHAAPAPLLCWAKLLLHWAAGRACTFLAGCTCQLMQEWLAQVLAQQHLALPLPMLQQSQQLKPCAQRHLGHARRLLLDWPLLVSGAAAPADAVRTVDCPASASVMERKGQVAMGTCGYIGQACYTKGDARVISAQCTCGL